MNEDADKKALKKFLRQGIGILSPRLKELWDLYENIQTWKDDKEKEKVRRFLFAYNDFLQFLDKFSTPGALVRTTSGTLLAFPGSEQLPAKMTAVVEAGAHIRWDKEPLERAEIHKLYKEVEKVMLGLVSHLESLNSLE